MRRFTVGLLVAATLLLNGVLPAFAAQENATNSQHGTVAAKDYKNCTALNKVYKHGVGKPGAVDHVSGHSQKVTNFTVNLKVYNANKSKDRDHDGIACEKL